MLKVQMCMYLQGAQVFVNLLSVQCMPPNMHKKPLRILVCEGNYGEKVYV